MQQLSLSRKNVWNKYQNELNCAPLLLLFCSLPLLKVHALFCDSPIFVSAKMCQQMCAHHAPDKFAKMSSQGFTTTQNNLHQQGIFGTAFLQLGHLLPHLAQGSHKDHNSVHACGFSLDLHVHNMHWNQQSRSTWVVLCYFSCQLRSLSSSGCLATQVQVCFPMCAAPLQPIPSEPACGWCSAVKWHDHNVSRRNVFETRYNVVFIKLENQLTWHPSSFIPSCRPCFNND